MAGSDSELVVHHASEAVNMPRTLRFKIMVGVFVFASCAGFAALASQKHAITAVSDSINFDQTQCSGGWQDLGGPVYLAGHVDGPLRGKKFDKGSQGIAFAKKACAGTASCSGITCKGTTCELRKGQPHKSPYAGETSLLCKGTTTAGTDQGPSCPGGWYQYGARFGSGFFHLGEFASGPNGGGQEFEKAAAEEKCMLESTCSGITCHGGGCTLRSGIPHISISTERSYQCRRGR